MLFGRKKPGAKKTITPRALPEPDQFAHAQLPPRAPGTAEEPVDVEALRAELRSTRLNLVKLWDAYDQTETDLKAAKKRIAELEGEQQPPP
jgi:hypothetical protein